LKNREKIIKKPITEKYDPVKVKIQKLSINIKLDSSKKLDDIIRETKKGDKHPHLKQNLLNDYKTKIEIFEKLIDNFQEETARFQKNILDEITSVEKEITDVENKDDVLDSLEAYFNVGREFTFSEIIEITKEGKHRYEFRIPPGYADFYSKKKKGTQIFGDLIIWKQILEFSKEIKKPIIFITNDTNKDNDWCYLDINATETRISSPREELIKEIKDNSSVDFWMYNLPQFLYQANQHLNSEIKEETILNSFQFINTNKNKKKSNYLKFKCNSCLRVHRYNKSDFNLDFEIVERSSRNMGIENHYQAQENFICSCKNIIEAKFDLWEYPVGMHNYDNVEIDNAELLDSFSFTKNFFEDEFGSNFCTCHECDGNNHGMGNSVSFSTKQKLINEYNFPHPNHKFSFIKFGGCDWCSSLHIRCVKCKSVNLLGEYQENENIECQGGCGLIYLKDTSDDFENIGDYDIKLIDDRIMKCSNCGNDFVNENNTEFCDECEEKYNNE